MEPEDKVDPAILWRFDAGQLRLICQSPEAASFSVDLRRITSSACMLDVIFDASSRPWANPVVVGELVKNLQILFDPRSTLCGQGRDHKLDPVAYIGSHIH